MELFYSSDIDAIECHLDAEESGHCVRVLRHREGDELSIIDGRGTLYRCTLVDANPKGATARIEERIEDFGSHPYKLTMAVCPTKNNDRFEWFAEKATEVGVDLIAPVIGDHSERKVFKADRVRRLVLSAAKQSLKGAIPEVREAESVTDFIKAAAGSDALKMICWCSGERTSVREALDNYKGNEYIILIGPEGDFSPREVALALECGFIPVHLGDSRLRTETAAVVAATAVYLNRL